MALEMFSLQHRRAVVTGASRGIGRALAVGLARAGADVAVLARSEEPLRETAGMIEQTGRSAIPRVCDVAEPESIRSAFADIRAQWSSLDVLVNNAGMNLRLRALEVSDEQYEAILRTNLRSAFVCSQEAARIMVEAGNGGRIISIGSVASLVAVDTGTPYAISKAGIDGMTRSLALEWGKHGITVNSIAPWYFRTPLTEKVLDDPKIRRLVLRRTPLGRVGRMEDLVGVAIFLASPAAAYITGQTIVVDGGVTIYGYSPFAEDD